MAIDWISRRRTKLSLIEILKYLDTPPLPNKTLITYLQFLQDFKLKFFYNLAFILLYNSKILKFNTIQVFKNYFAKWKFSEIFYIMSKSIPLYIFLKFMIIDINECYKPVISTLFNFSQIFTYTFVLKSHFLSFLICNICITSSFSNYI